MPDLTNGSGKSNAYTHPLWKDTPPPPTHTPPSYGFPLRKDTRIRPHTSSGTHIGIDCGFTIRGHFGVGYRMYVGFTKLRLHRPPAFATSDMTTNPTELCAGVVVSN